MHITAWNINILCIMGNIPAGASCSVNCKDKRRRIMRTRDSYFPVTWNRSVEVIREAISISKAPWITRNNFNGYFASILTSILVIQMSFGLQFDL